MPNLIRKLRKAKGLTTEALAAEVGISAAYLSRIERDKRNLSERMMRKLAGALRVSPSDLIEETGPQAGPEIDPNVLEPLLIEVFLALRLTQMDAEVRRGSSWSNSKSRSESEI